MKPMSPEDAQIVFVGVKENGSHLAIGYRRALETIAGMREEWGVSYRRVSYRRGHENEKRTTWGWETREDAERAMRQMTDVHVYGPVRRYVTTPEEA